jgi:hypothetical protein
LQTDGFRTDRRNTWMVPRGPCCGTRVPEDLAL